MKLVGDGGCWVKLSGAHRLSNNAPDYPEAKPFHEALVRANPERLVWGSDWPHATSSAGLQPMPDDARQIDRLAHWAQDERQLQRILVSNPARLYDFPTSTLSN